MQIYKQSTAGECGAYASLNTLQRMGVNITEKEILSFPSMFGFPDIERTLVKRGIIKGLSILIAPKRIETYLKEGVPLICLMYGNNFASVRNPPYIQDFNGKMQHFVCLIEDLGDRYKYVDQQGVLFGDKGHGYIMKSDLNKTKIFKVNI